MRSPDPDLKAILGNPDAGACEFFLANEPAQRGLDTANRWGGVDDLIYRHDVQSAVQRFAGLDERMSDAPPHDHADQLPRSARHVLWRGGPGRSAPPRGSAGDPPQPGRPGQRARVGPDHAREPGHPRLGRRASLRETAIPTSSSASPTWSWPHCDPCRSMSWARSAAPWHNLEIGPAFPAGPRVVVVWVHYLPGAPARSPMLSSGVAPPDTVGRRPSHFSIMRIWASIALRRMIWSFTLARSNRCSSA